MNAKPAPVCPTVNHIRPMPATVPGRFVSRRNRANDQDTAYCVRCAWLLVQAGRFEPAGAYVLSDEPPGEPGTYRLIE